MAELIKEKEEYISKLETQIQVIDNILKMDSGTVLNEEHKKSLRNLKQEAEIVRDKLRDNKFEIAIVGLEKVGKSTFANALIEKKILPTKDQRCTYISTKIEYSDDKNDSATVSFYRLDEFEKDFKDKLYKLGFPNYERYSFDTIDENKYLSIYESDVPENNKKYYGSNIHNDILAIIKNKDKLLKLLEQPPKAFNSNDIDSGKLESYITDETKAPAIKQVVIFSNMLSEMKNATIFDVPGFNSPTEFHKIQTLERMKSADAIIVIAHGKNTSLTEESLKILYDSDDEGNPLNDKLFVFANRIEEATDIKKNIDDTYSEWIDKGQYVNSSNRHRIIFGSALAHLQAKKLDNGDRVLKFFQEIEKQLPNGDGIDHIRQELVKYNQTERFEVLKRRINRIKANIRNIFSDIISENEVISSMKSYSMDQVSLIPDLIDDIRPLAKNKLRELRAEIRLTMPSEKPLSNKIIDYISANVTVDKYRISDDLINSAIKQTPYIGNHEDVGRIEGDIRKIKFKEMYNDFSQNVINIADDYHTTYSSKILDIIFESMGVDNISPYYNELRDILKKEISAYRNDLLASNELYYQSLIERFSRYIYQILITSQYSVERLREFYDSIDNFYSLSVFYKKPDAENDLSYIDIPPKDQPLCMMLLFHHYINIDDSLSSFVDEIKGIAKLVGVPDYILQCAKKALFAVGGNKNGLIKKIKEELSGRVTSDDDFKFKVLNNIFSGFIENNESCSVADKESFTKYYENYHSSIRAGKLYSVEDFRHDFDSDIQILQDVLINALVRAISIEIPFVARETKSIDDIIDYIDSKNFSKFLTSNFYKIKYEETQSLDKKHREQEQNAMIIRDINGILNSLAN